MIRTVYLGAGSDRIPNFVHLDNNVSKQFKRGMRLSRPEVISDLRDPLPFSDNSVDVIYTIHTLEHLSYPDLVNCLLECNRILNEGGIIRIVVPCFDCMIKDYLAKKSVDDKPWEVDSTMPLEDHVDFFVARVFYHDHRYLHNFQTLTKVLTKTGFSEVLRCGPGETRLPTLKSVFAEKELTRYGDVIVEGRKVTANRQSSIQPYITRDNSINKFSKFLNLRVGRVRGLLPCFPERLWFYEKILKFQDFLIRLRRRQY